MPEPKNWRGELPPCDAIARMLYDGPDATGHFRLTPAVWFLGQTVNDGSRVIGRTEPAKCKRYLTETHPLVLNLWLAMGPYDAWAIRAKQGQVQ